MMTASTSSRSFAIAPTFASTWARTSAALRASKRPLVLAQAGYPDAGAYKLADLVGFFEIETAPTHRALAEEKGWPILATLAADGTFAQDTGRAAADVDHGGAGTAGKERLQEFALVHDTSLLSIRIRWLAKIILSIIIR